MRYSVIDTGGRLMRIYVAGPYSAPTPEERLDNTIRAMKVGRDLIKLGHAPYIPHLTHYFDEWLHSIDDSISYDTYIEWGLDYLDRCDAIFRIGTSPGTDIECEIATMLGIPIITTIQDVPDMAWPEEATG